MIDLKVILQIIEQTMSYSQYLLFLSSTQVFILKTTSPISFLFQIIEATMHYLDILYLN
jgi:hypothetical protein